MLQLPACCHNHDRRLFEYVYRLPHTSNKNKSVHTYSVQINGTFQLKLAFYRPFALFFVDHFANQRFFNKNYGSVRIDGFDMISLTPYVARS